MNERLRRLLLLVPLAHARPGIGLGELAHELSCDENELRRDLDLLACVGAPPFSPDDLIDVELVNDRVYVHLPLHFDRPTRLTATEAAALVAAGRAFAPHDPTIARAAAKLSDAIAPTQKALFEALLERFLAAPPDGSETIVPTLNRAIAARHEVELLYYSPSDLAARHRRVRPRAIASIDGVAYLSAQNEGGAERTYRLERIARATRLETTFDEPPPIDLAAQLARTATFESRTDLPHATIRFTSRVAESARMRHPVASPVENGVEARIAYASLPWLVSYALSWGGQARIVAPEEAKTAFQQAVLAALDAHSEQ